MKHSVVRIATLVLALVMVLSYGCVSTEGRASAEEKTTIRIWQRNSGAGGPLYEFSKWYTESQDEINFVYEGYGENYDNMVQMALISDDVPDIFEVTSTMTVSDLAAAGYILSLDDMLTDEFKAEFVPSTFVKKDYQYNGEIYCVPLRLAHYKLLYNTDLFAAAGIAEPPKTLEELREYAKLLTNEEEGVYGIGIYTNYNDFWPRYIDAINTARGKSAWHGFDYANGQFDFSAHKDVFNFWVDVSLDGSSFPGAVTLGVEQMRAYFAQGKVAMMIDGNWMSTQYAMNIPTEINWSACDVPIFEGETRAVGYMNADIPFVVAANGKNVNKALEVLKTIYQNQTEFRAFGECDTKTYIAANDPACFEKLPTDKYRFQAYNEMNEIENHAAFPVEPHKFIVLEGDDRKAVMDDLYARAIDGEDVSAALDTALADLNTRYNAALAEAVADGLLLEEEIKPEGFDWYNR